jgi:hypothetical protein
MLLCIVLYLLAAMVSCSGRLYVKVPNRKQVILLPEIFLIALFSLHTYGVGWKGKSNEFSVFSLDAGRFEVKKIEFALVYPS